MDGKIKNYYIYFIYLNVSLKFKRPICFFSNNTPGPYSTMHPKGQKR